MVSDWIDHIELRRDAHANFTVPGKGYGEDPVTDRRRWFELDKMERLKNPMEIYQALENAASLLHVEIEWVDAIPLIASIDRVTGAVMAENTGQHTPPLPGTDVILEQRSLRALGKVTIGAEWGYYMHELSLNFERWIRILGGASWTVEMPYWYEGERFMGTWSFDNSTELDVAYEGDGVGWTGTLADLDIIDGPVVDEVDLAKLALDSLR